MNDDHAYSQKAVQDEAAYEAACLRCGECCGAFSQDPCSNLMKQDDQRYTCAVYGNRFGPQKSLSGNTFICVTIRDVIKSGAIFSRCGYMK